MLPARKFVDETISTTQENARDNFRVISNVRHKEKVKRNRSVKIDVTICVVALFMMSLVYVSLEARVTTIGYEINQLKAEIETAENYNSRLMLEVEELSSPTRIAEFAATQKGMVKATEANIIYEDGLTLSGDPTYQMASAYSTNAVGSGSVEILEPEAESHPIIDTFSALLSRFTNNENEIVSLAATE